MPTVFLSQMMWVFPLPQAERMMPLQAFGFCKLKKRAACRNTQGGITGEAGGL